MCFPSGCSFKINIFSIINLQVQLLNVLVLSYLDPDPFQGIHEYGLEGQRIDPAWNLQYVLTCIIIPNLLLFLVNAMLYSNI